MLLVLTWAIACDNRPATPPDSPDVPASTIVPRDVPILGRSLVERQVYLLTGDHQIVRVDPLDGRVKRMRPHWRTREPSLAGLAWHEDRLWVLSGRSTLVGLTRDGEVTTERYEPRSYVTVLAWRDWFILQSFDIWSPGPVLRARSGTETVARPFGSFSVSTVDLGEPDRLARRVVACGASRGRTLPCWYWIAAEIELVGLNGRGEWLAVRGLQAAGDASKLTAARRPIRDAFVDEEDRIWVLVTVSVEGAAPVQTKLQRYGSDGALEREADLPDPARLVLWAGQDGVVLLLENGGLENVEEL